MARARTQVNLDRTIAYTQSSFAYKEPFNPNGGALYKLINRGKTFFSARNIENEFIDFKKHDFIKEQIPDLYHQASEAFKRSKQRLLPKL